MVVQEVINAFCKKFSEMALAEILCHVHHLCDIVDLFGLAPFWVLYEEMISDLYLWHSISTMPIVLLRFFRVVAGFPHRILLSRVVRC
jgi:hypothetical protein